MATENPRNELERDVVIATREFGISTTLFRHVVGEHLGVNVTDMECLGLLFFRGVSTPKALSEYTGLSSGATTAMLHRLERARLIKRRPNPDDHRGFLIEVDPASVQAVGPLFAATRAGQEAMLTRYSNDQLMTVRDFLRDFTAVWESGREKLQRDTIEL